jgi:glycosyltransferase involved in cell wall biosynthesis
LLAYKNVEAVIDAFRFLANERLVVVGSGPEEERLAAKAGNNVVLLKGVSDAQLRWLYANARAIVAAAYEDFGLTPLEGAIFGKPTAALRFGGFLDTIEEGTNGVYFEQPTAQAVAEAVTRLGRIDWDRGAIRAHAERFSEDRFIARLREVVEEVGAQAA